MSLREELIEVLECEVRKISLMKGGRKVLEDIEKSKEFFYLLNEEEFLEDVQALVKKSFVLRMKDKLAFRRVSKDSSKFQLGKVLSSLLTHILIEADMEGEVYFLILSGDQVAKEVSDISNITSIEKLQDVLEGLEFYDLIDF